MSNPFIDTILNAQTQVRDELRSLGRSLASFGRNTNDQEARSALADAGSHAIATSDRLAGHIDRVTSDPLLCVLYGDLVGSLSTAAQLVRSEQLDPTAISAALLKVGDASERLTDALGRYSL